MKNERWKEIGLFLVAPLMAVILYFPAIWFQYVDRDDPIILLNNPIFKSWDFLAFFSPAAAHDFIPLTLMSFFVEHSLVGFTPMLYHLDNIILYALSCFLISLIGRELGLNPWMRTVWAILFALHPTHIESVAWVTQRKDMLAGFLSLLAILFYLKSGEPKRRLPFFFSFIFFVLATLSKPSAVMLPFCLILFDYFKGRGFRATLIFESPFFLWSIIISVIGIQFHNKEIQGGIFHSSFIEKIASGIFGLIFYLSKSILPIGLSPLYGMEFELALVDYFAASIICILFAMIIRSKDPDARRIAIFSALFFLVSIFPALNISSFTNTFRVADRYLYFPSIGITFFFSYLLDNVFRRGVSQKSVHIGAATLVTILLFSLSVGPLKAWRDNETLWRAVIAAYPNTGMAQLNVGALEVDKGNLDAAAPHFEKSMEFEPARSNFNLGSIQERKGNLEGALEYYGKAGAADVSLLFPFTKGGEMAFRLSKFDIAEKFYAHAAELDGKNLEIKYNWGVSLYRIGKKEEGLQKIGEVAAASPDNLDAQLGMGRAFLELGRKDEAKVQFQKILEKWPDNPVAKQFMGVF